MKFPTDAAERVARILAEDGPSTVGSLASALDASATAVRRPLRALVDAGLVQSRDRAPYGPDRRNGRGRPSQVYALTTKGRAACDQAYDSLALDALRFLETRGGRSAVGEFAQDRARQLIGDVGSGRRGMISRVARRLREQGYAATVEPVAGEAVQLCQHHCPVVDVATEYPEFCDAETAALGKALGRHVTRLASLAQGDGVCTTLIPMVKERSSQ